MLSKIEAQFKSQKLSDHVRVRIAPSPTGYPHIGTIYQALFNYAFAKKHSGTFTVRIEDTDRSRFVEGAEEKIFEALDWFGLTEDESPRKDGMFGPYRQSEKLPVYQKHAKELVEKNHAYYCFCSKERLEELRKTQQQARLSMMYDGYCRNLSSREVSERLQSDIERVIRLKIPKNTKIVIRDEIRGEITFDSSTVDDQVLLKSDGYPTYHLAATVDDHFMEITHVVRGEEWLTSTPKHFLLYDFFGWEKPLFFHTADLRNPDKSKLSKRHGHTNVSWYKENGFLPEAILNFLALLGWSHPEEKELFSLDEFIQFFDLKDIRPVGPVFDLKKLEWLNGEYIRQMTQSQLISKLIRHLADQNSKLQGIDNSLLEKIIPLAQTRMNTLNDFWTQAGHFFEEPEISVQDEKAREIVRDLFKKLTQLIDWKSDEIFTILKEVMVQHSIKMPVLYRLLIGADRGLPLPQSLEILGKEKTITRLRSALAH